jgi:hypothetical protein
MKKGNITMPKKKTTLSEGVKKVTVREPVGTIRRNIDYGIDLHTRLESASEELNISSQALVKIALQEWIDRYTLAQHYSKMKKTGTDK